MKIPVEIDRKNAAIYLNFPFCKEACAYCHYKQNIKFGYSIIPSDYFAQLCENLGDFCKLFYGSRLKSIYFGGGTPSLLTDNQLDEIESIFKKYNICSDEVSMELHPSHTNFSFMANQFITRYSIAVQSFDEKYLRLYNRTGYNFTTISNIIMGLRSIRKDLSINIDLIFDNKLPCNAVVLFIEDLAPDTVTIYPNTRGRGCDRLLGVLQTLRIIQSKFEHYRPLLKSSFIFVRTEAHQSSYSKIQCESFGDIFGIGHNSVSFIGNKSYLTRYNGKEIDFSERVHAGSRYLCALFSSLPTGVKLGSVRAIFPSLLYGHYLHTVSNDADINEKHTLVADEDMVYLPVFDYIRFFECFVKFCEKHAQKAFLSAIGFGDDDYLTISDMYNHRILLNDIEMYELKNIIGNGCMPEFKLKVPVRKILVEGIDGSGKDSFVKIFSNELKKRFIYDEKSPISVLGQPDSTLSSGTIAKDFVENLKFESELSVLEAMQSNRLASEKKISQLNGISILIRGLVTDKATYYYAFHKDASNLGDGIIISSWDYFIVTDVDPDVADDRIEQRGIPRTWRESLSPLTFFRNFYLNYNSELFRKKIVIRNLSFEVLDTMARKLANEIYAEEYRKLYK